MKALLFPAIALAAAASPAPAFAASVFDYGVYATNGATLSGGSYGKVAAGTVTATAGTAVTSSVAGTAALTDRARAFSAELAGRAATGTVVRTPGLGLGLGTVALFGTGAGVDVFNLTADDFARAGVITFAGLGSGAVINVAGTSVSARSALNLNLALGALAAENVLFNFRDATAVTLSNVALGGSVLAPNALVTLSGGGAAGSVVASGVTAAGATVGGRGFVGIGINGPAPVAAPVPEAATWATMLLGLGLGGAGLRQRRRARVAFA